MFSVAATYVVAGKEGVKQYHLLRQRAFSKLGYGNGDVFHDTEKVQREVTEWHNYLRTIVRAQDAYTAKVLDIVDNSMLVMPGESRISGQDLTMVLGRIDSEAKRKNAAQVQPPEQILDFLDELMNGGQQRPEIEDIPRTITQSGADMFQEALLYRSLRSDGRSPVLRTPSGTPAIIRGTTTGRETLQDPRELAPYKQNAPFLPKSLPMRPIPPQLGITTVSGPIPSPSEPPIIPPVTFWEVEAELEEYGKKSRIPGLKLPSNTLNRRVSVFGKPFKDRDDQLIEHFKSRDIVS